MRLGIHLKWESRSQSNKQANETQFYSLIVVITKNVYEESEFFSEFLNGQA